MAFKLPRTSEDVDRYLQFLTVGTLLLYIFFYSSVFEQQYPHRYVELYQYPWWRLALISLVALGAWWSPQVGLVLAIAVYLYLHDMYVLTTPFTNIQS